MTNTDNNRIESLLWQSYSAVVNLKDELTDDIQSQLCNEVLNLLNLIEQLSERN